MTLQQLVAFAILMEKDEGILGKYPKYISEMFELVTDLEDPRILLDPQSWAKYERYLATWIRKVDTIEI